MKGEAVKRIIQKKLIFRNEVMILSKLIEIIYKEIYFIN